MKRKDRIPIFVPGLFELEFGKLGLPTKTTLKTGFNSKVEIFQVCHFSPIPITHKMSDTESDDEESIISEYLKLLTI